MNCGIPIWLLLFVDIIVEFVVLNGMCSNLADEDADVDLGRRGVVPLPDEGSSFPEDRFDADDGEGGDWIIICSEADDELGS